MLDVYIYGSGECDQLGLDNSDILEAKIPKKVPISNLEPSSKVYQICCGGMHTLVLTTMGKIFSWGCNDDGALGREGSESKPILIENLPPMTNVVAGDSFSLAYNTDLNIVYQWGGFRNNSGKIADPIRGPKELDRKLFSNKSIKKIVCGANHALAIAGKSLYGWGDCELGQIGKMAKATNSPDWSLKPQAFLTKEVVDVFSGKNHSFLICLKGKRKIFKGWGHNNWGQLGIGNKTNTCVPTEVDFFDGMIVKHATGGDHHSVVLLENGEVYSWGRNDEGQCGILKGEEDLNDTIGTPRKITTFTKENEITDIVSSMNFNYAASESKNEVYSWGMGEMYVLGNKKDDNQTIPYSIPKEFFFNKKVHNISLGSSHVALCLADPTIEKFPELEYDYEAAREELRKKHLESKPVSKKRKIDLGIDIEKIEEGHKRERKKVDYNVEKKPRIKKLIEIEKIVKKEIKEKKEEKEKNINYHTQDKDNTGKKKKSLDLSCPKNDKEMKIENEPKQHINGDKNKKEKK